MLTVIRYFLLLSFFSASASFAVEVKDLYSASVNVLDRSKASFNAAADIALLRVLVKASGNDAATIQNEPRLAQDLKDAARWVERFSYHQDNEQLQLKLSFPEKRITTLLQQGGLNLWLSNRPLSLVLPVVQKQGQKELIRLNRNDDYSFNRAIDRQASAFGLPVVTAASNNSDVLESLWVFNLASINNLSQQIQHDVVFTARVAITSAGRYTGAWYLIDGDKTSYIDATADNAEEFTKIGFAWLAKHFAKQYSLRFLTAHNEHLLVVSDVQGHQDYQSLLTYLESHNLISHVYLIEANNQQLSLSLVLKADTTQLKKSFSLDKKLQEIESDSEAFMQFKWL